MEVVMLYTMEQLKDKNMPFLSEHSMRNLDVKIVNDFVKKIESSRKGAILPGDSVRLTTEYGEYFHNARVLSVYGGLWFSAKVAVLECKL